MSDYRPPVDGDTTMYVLSETGSLGDILERAKEKWGQNIDLDRINVTAEDIQVRCFGYDQYDSSDYSQYIVLEYSGE